MSIIERISAIRKHKGLNKSEFERSINKSSGYLNILEKRQSNPSTDVLIDILDNYPEFSLDWILRGKGEMLLNSEEESPKSPNTFKTAEPAPEYGVSKEIEIILRQQLADKDKIIQMLEEKIENLTGSSRKGLAG